MIRAHVKAVRDALTAVPNLNAYDAQAPNTAQTPFVVLFSDDGPEGQPMFDGRRINRTWTVATQHFGGTPDEARWAAEKVETALMGKRLTVANRACTATHRLTTQTMQRDDSVDPPVFFTVTVWRFASVATATA